MAAEAGMAGTVCVARWCVWLDGLQEVSARAEALVVCVAGSAFIVVGV